MMHLLSTLQGFTTYSFRPAEKLFKRYYALQLLEQHIPAEAKNQVTGLQLCADHQVPLLCIVYFVLNYLCKKEEITR